MSISSSSNANGEAHRAAAARRRHRHLGVSMAAAAAVTPQPAAGAFGFASEWHDLAVELKPSLASLDADTDAEFASRAFALLKAKFPGKTWMLGFDVGIFLPPDFPEEAAGKAKEKQAFQDFMGPIKADVLFSIYLEGPFGATGIGDDAPWDKGEAKRFVEAAIDTELTTREKAMRFFKPGHKPDEVIGTDKLEPVLKRWDTGKEFWQHTLGQLEKFKQQGFVAAEIDNLGRPLDDAGSRAFDRPGLRGRLGFYRHYADAFAGGTIPRLILKNLDVDVLEALAAKLIPIGKPDSVRGIPRAMLADFHICEADEMDQSEQDDIAEASAKIGIQTVFSFKTEEYRTHGDFRSDALAGLKSMTAPPIPAGPMMATARLRSITAAAPDDIMSSVASASPAELLVELRCVIARFAALAEHIEGSAVGGETFAAVEPEGRAVARLGASSRGRLAAGAALAAAAGQISLTAAQRLLCERVINCFETGTIRGDYSDISIFPDGPDDIRQITYGRAQTTEYGNLRQLVEMYVAAGGRFADDLRTFVPKIGRQASPLVDNATFKNLLKRAGREDSVMATVQDDFFDKVYFQKAKRWANDNGFSEALSMLVIYDSHIHSGSMRQELRDRFPEVPPARGGDEREWIRQYIDVRHEWLRNHHRPDVRTSSYRTRDLKREIARGNWDLGQLPISANGVSVDAS